VRVEHRSSLDPSASEIARSYLGGDPELVFIDSSHEYQDTLLELDIWFEALTPGGLIVLHDTSKFAESFDVTNKGGVRRALHEWRRSHPHLECFSLNDNIPAANNPQMSYQDFCGVGLIQKPVQE
jgi:cephalosporin hydroxylase